MILHLLFGNSKLEIKKKNFFFFHNRIKKSGSWSEKSVTLFFLSDPLGTTNEEKVTAA